MKVVLLLIFPLAIMATPNPLGKEIEVPNGGPCLFNADKLKCTDNGFYEMVQCDRDSCFCVDSHNGQIAELTRTQNNRVAPKCSACHIFIRDQFSSKTLPNTNFVPKCDNQYGLYDPLQCEGKTCVCVDPKSGKEIAGSQQKNENNNKISCDKSDRSFNRPDRIEAPVAREYCKLKQDRGHSCHDGNSKVMYFFDTNTFTCLAFKYNGCGGNSNRFVSESECHSNCELMDFSSCAFLRKPAVDAKGETILCGVPMPVRADMSPTGEPENDGCPSAHQCIMGAFFGFCCPRATEEKMNKAYHPTCKKGKPFSTNTDGFENILFGQTCADDFCPQGYKCAQEEVFAHCCPI